jgi:hypothetical protein
MRMSAKVWLAMAARLVTTTAAPVSGLAVLMDIRK